MGLNSENYDAIIIGSGLGGLTTAARLSKLGYKVAVFEKQQSAGGYADGFSRKGFKFDSSMRSIGGFNSGGDLRNALESCGVLHRISPIKNKEAYTIVWKNEEINIPNDIGTYRSLLLSRFPNEEKGIDKLLSAIGKFYKGYIKSVIEEEKNILSILNADVAAYKMWCGKNVYDIIKGYVRSEEFITFFTALWSYFGMPPKMLSAESFFISWVSYHLQGKYYIEGGSKRLADAFIEAINVKEGKIFTNSEVVKIKCRKNSINEIILADGREFTARYVISNISPIKLAELIPNGVMSKELINKIERNKIGSSITQLYLGLRCNPKKVGLDKEELVYITKDNHETEYLEVLKNKYEQSGFIITNYNELDSKLNEFDKGVVTVTFVGNYDCWGEEDFVYARQKSEVTERIIEMLECRYPGIKDNIEVAELATPRTMEKITGNPRGAVYGFARSVDKSGKNRINLKTSIDNLYMVGAWVGQATGCEGAITSGMLVAKEVDIKLKK